MSLARAADQAFKLALRVGSIRQSRVELSDMVEQLDQDWALFPLVHDDGSIGAMCIDPVSNIAFVEQQTLGCVNRASPPSPRKLTRTDKALALPFSERFLRLFDTALEGAPTAYWTQGYRTEDAVETRHLMVLLLDASEYRGFEMSSDIEGSDQKSVIRFFLPIKEKQTEKPARVKRGNKDRSTKERPKLRNAALAASVEMDAIMCKITMPLTELSTLKEGQLLKLPQNAAQNAQLQDRVGQTQLPVHLGQLHGMRAVRLVQAQDTSRASPEPSTEDSVKPRDETVSKTPITPENEEQNQRDELDDLLALGKS